MTDVDQLIKDLVDAGVFVQDGDKVRLSFSAYKAANRILLSIPGPFPPADLNIIVAKKLLKRYKLDDPEHVGVLVAYFEA